MRKFLILFAAVFLVGSAVSQVYYEGQIDSDNSRINMSLKLDCDPGNCPVSVWRVTMNVPTSADIVEVKSARGEVQETDRNGGDLKVKSRTPPSESEKITIVYDVKDDRKHVYSGLFTQRINLPGFNDESNSGTLEIKNLLSASPSRGFEISKKRDGLNYTGLGPGSVTVATGQGFETKYYEFFGDDPENTSIAYEVTAGTLGFNQRFERLPVAVMPDREYNESINTWSAGQYTNATLVVRDSLEEDFLPILAHETVHAFNDQRLKWSAESSWFDEGVSRYIEYLTKKALEGETRTRPLFWEDRTFTKYEDGARYRYTLPSKGEKDALWQYYQDERDFIKHWSPESGNRDFGYSYAELVIRNHVSNGNSLSELYENVDKRVLTDEGKWDLVSREVDLTPCKFDSRERFDACLEKINEYDYPVYRAENLSATNYSIEVRQLDLAEKNTQNGSGALLPNNSDEVAEKSGRKDNPLKNLLEMLERMLNAFLR